MKVIILKCLNIKHALVILHSFPPSVNGQSYIVLKPSVTNCNVMRMKENTSNLKDASKPLTCSVDFMYLTFLLTPWVFFFLLTCRHPGHNQVPLVEDLEQIFMRSWRESHLSEIRQFQQPHTPATQGRLYGIEVTQ